MRYCKYCNKPVIKAIAPYLCCFSIDSMTNEERAKAIVYNKVQAGKPLGYYIHETFIGSNCEHVMLDNKETIQTVNVSDSY